MDSPTPSSVHDLKQQAHAAVSVGNLDHALQLLTQATQLDPNNPSLVLDLAQLTFQSGNLDDAERLLKQLPESEQNSREAKTLSALFRFSEIVMAAPDLDTLQNRLQQDPNHLQSLYQFAAYMMLHHQIEAALKSLLASIQIDKSDQGGRAQKLLLEIFVLLEPDQPQLINHYRRQLQNILY